jgi:hypothetical protein
MVKGGAAGRECARGWSVELKRELVKVDGVAVARLVSPGQGLVSSTGLHLCGEALHEAS